VCVCVCVCVCFVICESARFGDLLLQSEALVAGIC
jgi:hypothetical protein